MSAEMTSLSFSQANHSIFNIAWLLNCWSTLQAHTLKTKNSSKKKKDSPSQAKDTARELCILPELNPIPEAARIIKKSCHCPLPWHQCFARQKGWKATITCTASAAGGLEREVYWHHIPRPLSLSPSLTPLYCRVWRWLTYGRNKHRNRRECNWAGWKC